MAKFRKEAKHEAMTLYAEGYQIGVIAERLDCHRNTIDMWRAKKDPADWDVFRVAAESERMKAALAEIRKKASETVRNQLEDSIDLRSTTKAALIDIASRIKDGKLDIDRDTMGMLKDIERILTGVQQQQNSIFDFPTHRIKVDEAVRSPLSVNQSDLKEMSNPELMTLLFDLNKDED